MDVKKRILLFAKELSEIVKKYRIDIVITKNEKGEAQFAFIDLDKDDIDIYGVKGEITCTLIQE